MARSSWFRQSPALVVAFVALFVALGGYGHAAGRTDALSGRVAPRMLKSPLVFASRGHRVGILRVGPFRFTLKCGGTPSAITAEVDVGTVTDHASFESNFSSRMGNFQRSDGAIQVTDPTTSGDPTKTFDGPGGAFAAIAPNGTTYVGDGFVGAGIRGHNCVGGVIVMF